MKKSLVALAALAATSAFAQNVTLYGVADVAYITKVHSDAAGNQMSKTTGIGEGLNAGNRIGFRGTEDLGGGSSVGFLIENGINITNGALFSTRAATAGQAIDGAPGTGGTGNNMPTGAYSTATNRQSYVSYGNSGLGEVRLGYQYTALYTLTSLSGYHLGSEQPGGDFAHGTMSNASYGGARANGFTYILPKLANNTTTVTLQKGAATGREDVDITTSYNGKTTDKNNRWSILVNYANGPLNASVAHTNNKIENNAVAVGTVTTTNFASAVTAASTAAVTQANQSNNLDQIGASYQLGSAKLTYHLAKGSINDSVTAASSVNTKAQQFGGEYASGQLRPFFIAGTGKITRQDTQAVTFDAKSTQWGLRYDLSKRSMAYFMSGKADDAAATTTTIKSRTISGFGLYHTF